MECDEEVSLWWWLFASGDTDLQRWACLRAWRCVALRKKRRFVKLTPRELLELAFVEDDLPLHAVILFIEGKSPAVQKLRFEWVQRIVFMFPAAVESLDRVQRIALHYALTRQWEERDQLSWLAAKSQKMLLRKDAEGLCLMAHAVINNCPEEVLMMMAVENARSAICSVELLMEGRHFESTRRLCVQMTKQHFAGVPNFPYAYCLNLLESRDVDVVMQGMLRVWKDFVDKWGYHGVPVITDDLPTLRHVPIDSYLQLTIKAKGEPLAYQWFCDGESILGAVGRSLFVSQCVQPHNQGQFHCEVTNWKGRAVTTSMRLSVVDDKHGPDPSLRYLLSDSDRRTLSEGDTVHRITASRGGLVHATSSSSHSILEGCTLLVPPKSFASYDANGIDVSDSVGLEVVVRQCKWTAGNTASHLALSRDEALVSTVVEVLPFSAPALAQPAILSIPHNWSFDSDKSYELVVIETPGAREPFWGGLARDNPRRVFQDVAKSRVLDKTDGGVVSFEVTRFGRFAVIARSIGALNKENERPLEELVLCLAHPRAVSMALGCSGQETIACSLWVACNRPDSIEILREQLKPAHGTQNRSRKECEEWTSTRIAIRKPQLLHIRIGSKVAFSHVWRGSDEAFVALATPDVACLRKEVSLRPDELALDPHHDGESSSTTLFRSVEISVVVLKPALYQSVKRASSRANTTRPLLPDGTVLLEKTRRIPIPVLHDILIQPPPPALHQRRTNQLALAYAPNGSSSSSEDRELRSAVSLFEELHETERDFTPYFYQLEIARFTESFWRRYDRTWWFDKTKSDILTGMYRIAHAGTEPFAVIASDAFAGVFRVVTCSIDATSPYSEPTLLEPQQQDLGIPSINPDDDDESSIPIGLRRILTLSTSLDLSPEAHASLNRLRSVLTAVYSSTDFVELFGVEMNVDAIRAHLDRHRDRFRAANRELALLLLGVERLASRVRKSILLRWKNYKHVIHRVRLLRRLIPEIDCFPLEYSSVAIALHTLFRDLFEIVWLRSAPGWLARFLLNDWGEQELRSLNDRVVRLLHADAHALQGAHEILEVFKCDIDFWSGVDFERQSLNRLREYLLLVLGQSSLMAEVHMTKHIARLIKLHVAPKVVQTLTNDNWEELVQNELRSEATTRALQYLRENDTLANHIRSVSPSDQERLPVKYPQMIEIRFGVHVASVDTQHAFKVSNVTLQCVVQGQTTFSREEKSLFFVPAIPFDKHTRYHAKLRAQYVQTALGSELPISSSISWQFSTGS